MKKLLTIILLFPIADFAYSQFSISFVNDFGVNLVDIEEATGSPTYENREFGTSTYLNEWDKFYYRGGLQALFRMNEKLAVGGEMSFHRLYYWEEAYFTSLSSSPNFRWGTVWTLGIGAILKYNLTDLVYIQPGLSLQNFLDGTGATLGITAAFGLDVPLGNSFTLPVELRTDLIPGDALSTGVGLGLGLRKNF